MTTDQKIKAVVEILIATQKNNLVTIEVNKHSLALSQAFDRNDREAAILHSDLAKEARSRLFTEEQVKENIKALEELLK